MSVYIKDLTERYPDAGEPEEEREYIVTGWVPMKVETRVYGINEDDAIEEAKRQIRKNRFKIVDRDLSDFEFSDIEKV